MTASDDDRHELLIDAQQRYVGIDVPDVVATAVPLQGYHVPPGAHRPLLRLLRKAQHALGIREIGAGGAYRNVRFRLDERDLEPNGIGEQRGIATFARVLYQLNPAISLSLHTGLVVDGELRIENEDAERRRSVEYDPAPLLALSLSARF